MAQTDLTPVGGGMGSEEKAVARPWPSNGTEPTPGTGSPGRGDQIHPKRRLRANTLRVRVLATFLANKMALAGVIGLAVVLLCAVFPSQIAPRDPLAQDLLNRMSPPAWSDGGSWDHILGTDRMGRDVLSRIILGAQISLQVAFITTTVSLILGVALGLLAGYRGGLLDSFIMRIADLQLGMPFYVIAIAVVAVLGPSLTNLLIVLSLWGWPMYGRVARGEMLSARELEYVEAARVVGAGQFRIMFRHILPNISSPLIVMWTFGIATMILSESGLSFLGLGVQPPTPSWGNMLSDGQQHIATAWWLATFPGFALMLTILAVNIVGDALRDALDPRFVR